MKNNSPILDSLVWTGRKQNWAKNLNDRFMNFTVERGLRIVWTRRRTIQRLHREPARSTLLSLATNPHSGDNTKMTTVVSEKKSKVKHQNIRKKIAKQKRPAVHCTMVITCSDAYRSGRHMLNSVENEKDTTGRD